MKESVYTDSFVRRFDEIGRSDNFSVSARYALFEYFEEYEESTGEEIDFDPIAICCDYSEYEDFADFGNMYFADVEQRNSECGIDEDADEDDIDAAIREYIEDQGQLIEFDGGIIVSAF